MKIFIVCGTCLREEDRLVLEYLEKCDDFPTVTMIAEETGLPPKRVERALIKIKIRARMWRQRKAWLEDEKDTNQKSNGGDQSG